MSLLLVKVHTSASPWRLAQRVPSALIPDSRGRAWWPVPAAPGWSQCEITIDGLWWARKRDGQGALSALLASGAGWDDATKTRVRTLIESFPEVREERNGRAQVHAQQVGRRGL